MILHGTDTLSYTASALSFILENLGKTVIITGSQIPIFETRTDGKDNFISGLILAGNYVIPGTYFSFVFFPSVMSGTHIIVLIQFFSFKSDFSIIQRCAFCLGIS